jgi:hypothetical protein
VTPPPSTVPGDIEALARARAAARAAREFARADAIRATIEAAGWHVIDHGTAFRLEPAAPPTIEEGGLIHFGSAAAVPSVLDVPAMAAFTVLLLADDWPEELATTLAGLRAHAAPGLQVVIVANEPEPAQAARLASGSPERQPIAGAEPEVIWTSARLGGAAALNVGLRRAAGTLVVLADASVEPTGDALTPLAGVLEDPGVAVTGAFGLSSPDLRHWVGTSGPDVDAIEACWLAFRRDDLRRFGPLDEKIVAHRDLDIWWSLVLRAGADPTRPARRAVRLDLPLRRHEGRGWITSPTGERDRLSKRSYYRLLERFREQRDLLSGRSTP